MGACAIVSEVCQGDMSFCGACQAMSLKMPGRPREGRRVSLACKACTRHGAECIKACSLPGSIVGPECNTRVTVCRSTANVAVPVCMMVQVSRS